MLFLAFGLSLFLSDYRGRFLGAPRNQVVWCVFGRFETGAPLPVSCPAFGSQGRLKFASAVAGFLLGSLFGWDVSWSEPEIFGSCVDSSGIEMLLGPATARMEEKKGVVMGRERDQFPVGMRVLAVDDDPVCLKVLETLLRRCQYDGKYLLGSSLRCSYVVQ